jgi:hypothetical protein
VCIFMYVHGYVCIILFFSVSLFFVYAWWIAESEEKRREGKLINID